MFSSDEVKVDKCVIAFVVGVLVTVIACIFVCGVVESTKVFNGYLTYQNRVYTVSLYSELNYPDSNEIARDKDKK